MNSKHRHHPYLPRAITPPLMAHISTQPPSNYFSHPSSAASAQLAHSPLQRQQSIQLARQQQQHQQQQGSSNSIHMDQYSLPISSEDDQRLTMRTQAEVQQQQKQPSEALHDQYDEQSYTSAQMQSMKPEPLLRKGRWSPGEDGRLLGCIDVYGPNKWKQVAREVGTRTGDQCWKRWNDSLDPTLKHDQWTQEEDEILEAAVAQLGRCWSKIATEKLNGRSGLACKNRMDHLNRKRRRTLNVQNQFFPRTRNKISRSEVKVGQMENNDGIRRDQMHSIALMDHQQQQQQQSVIQNENNSFENLNASHRNHEYFFPNKINEIDFGHRNFILPNQTPTSSPIWWNGNGKDVGRNGFARQAVSMQGANGGIWNVPSAYNASNIHPFTPTFSATSEVTSSSGMGSANVSAIVHPLHQSFSQNTNIDVHGYNPHGFSDCANVVPSNMYDCRPHAAPNYSSSYPSSQHSSGASMMSSPESEVSSSSVQHIHSFASPHPLDISALTAPTNISSSMAPVRASNYTINQDDINAAYYSSSSPPQTSMAGYYAPQLTLSSSSSEALTAVADDRVNGTSNIANDRLNPQQQPQQQMGRQESQNADNAAEDADVTNGNMIETHLNLNSFSEGVQNDGEGKGTNPNWYPASQEVV